MRTTLNLDDDAIRGAMAVAPGMTKTQIVNDALRRYAVGKRRKELLRLRGRIRWEGDIDALRGRK